MTSPRGARHTAVDEGADGDAPLELVEHGPGVITPAQPGGRRLVTVIRSHTNPMGSGWEPYGIARPRGPGGPPGPP
jgi:hypothetical protein